MGNLIESSAADKIRAGVNKTANLIKVTMGPLGKYVSIDFGKYDWPVTTNDGVTVANNIHLKDRFENIGSKYVKQAAQKTNDIAGDGTTTASVLVQSLVEEGFNSLNSGIPAIQLRREIEQAVKEVLSSLKEQKVVIKQDDMKSLADIATISCRDSKLGEMIASLVSEIGSDGVITIEDSPLQETETERVEGLKVRGGLLSPFFVNHRAFQQAVYDNVPIIVTDYAVTHGEEIVHLMEQIYSKGFKQAILVAAQIDGAAMQAVINNKLQKKFDMLPVRVIAYGPIGEGYLMDICAATGASFISERQGRKLMDFSGADAGKATKVVAGAHETAFIGGAGDYQERVEELKNQLPNVKALEEESLKERIAKLQSKTATIKVGGAIDSEREEIKKRIEDAVNSTKAALSDGIVTGGGSALYRTAHVLELNTYGAQVVKKAIQAPLKTIADNSEVQLDKGELQQITKDNSKTYDFTTGQVVDAYKSGIIDPAKVVSTALQNASSAASLILINKGAIIVPENDGEEL